MKIKIYLYFVILSFLVISCSKKEIKKSEIKEKSLDLQVYEAYKEGKVSLESGDVLFAAKNLMKLKFYFLSRNGHLNQL